MAWLYSAVAYAASWPLRTPRQSQNRHAACRTCRGKNYRSDYLWMPLAKSPSWNAHQRAAASYSAYSRVPFRYNWNWNGTIYLPQLFS